MYPQGMSKCSDVELRNYGLWELTWMIIDQRYLDCSARRVQHFQGWEKTTVLRDWP